MYFCFVLLVGAASQKSKSGNSMDLKTTAKPVMLDTSKYRLPTSYGPVLNKKMANGTPLTKDEYNELVRLVAAPIALDFTLKPHSDSLMYIARKVVEKYGNMSFADNTLDSLVSVV